MAAQPDVLLRCFEQASSAAAPALRRCIDNAVAELQALEACSVKIVARDELNASWRFLLANKGTWSEAYAADLLAEFTKATRAKSSASSPAPNAQFTRSGFASFGLVDDAQLSQAIDGQRLLQNLLPNVEQKLAELDTLVSSAMGLDYVAPERNPMRPEVFTQALQRLATQTVDGAAATVLSFKALSQPLGRELMQIYANSINTLQQASVAAASYQFRLQPSRPPVAEQGGNASGGELKHSSTQPSGANPRTGSPLPPAVNLSDYRVRADLLHDFLLKPSAGGEQVLSAPYYDDIEQELADFKAAADSASAALHLIEQASQEPSAHVAVVDRPARRVDGTTALNEQVWGPYGTSRARAVVRTQIKKQATKVSQALGLEVVRELVNQVAQDSRLLAPVRESILALEPSLLRLALVDPRFFSDERHPARTLMERVAQRSFNFNDEFSDEFAEFFGEVCRSFKRLNAATIVDAQPFASALADLLQVWSDQDKDDFDKRQQVLQALHFAEERQSNADQLAFELSSRSDLQQVPAKVLDFLFGRWALVMAHARLVDTRSQIDPSGYGSVVPDLVWSVKREVTLKEPAKLIEMIPGLLVKLHSGLALLGQEPVESEAFFEYLMKLHQPVLKLRRLKSQRDAEESSAAPLESSAHSELEVSPAERLEKLRAQADAPLWLDRDDLEAAGFEDTQPTEPGDLDALSGPADAKLEVSTGGAVVSSESEICQNDAAEGEPTGVPTAALTAIDSSSDQLKEQAAATLRSLRTGQWIDLYSKHQWLRAQLVWASTKATLFMFISQGGRPHSMTQRSCEKLIAKRLLRVVDTQGVIAQALDGVAVVAQAQKQAAHASSSKVLQAA